jgi:hypothetical protein
MRLFEIETQQSQIVATKRFLKNSAFYFRGYPGIEATLKEFLHFKQQNPKAQFGKKDIPFTGGPLKGLFHVHLIHGKVILVYGLRGNQIRLFDMVEHDDFEGKSIPALAKYIDSLGMNDLSPVKTGAKPTPSLTAEQKQELSELFWEMGVQDRDILEDAAKGNIESVMEFCRMTVEGADDTAILAALGGKEGLIKAATTVLHQTTG